MQINLTYGNIAYEEQMNSCKRNSVDKIRSYI